MQEGQHGQQQRVLSQTGYATILERSHNPLHLEFDPFFKVGCVGVDLAFDCPAPLPQERPDLLVEQWGDGVGKVIVGQGCCIVASRT